MVDIETQKILHYLGIQYLTEDLKDRPMNDIIADIGKRFASMPDGTIKSNIAQKLFGEWGEVIIPIFNEIGKHHE